MSPFSLAHIIDQVVRDKASRMALEDRENGRGGDIPASLYLERIAERLGVTKRMIYRYMEGSTSPSVSTLVHLCAICESTLPMEWACREVGLGYYRRAHGDPVGRADIVGLVSHQLQDAGKTAKDVLGALEDERVTPAEAKTIMADLDDAADAITDLKAAILEYVGEGKSPIPFERKRA